MMDSLEIIASCDSELGLYSKINDYMKNHGYSRSRFAQPF